MLSLEQLQVISQILVILLLLLLVGIFSYIFVMVRKIHEKVMIVLELMTYVEKAKDTVIAIMDGPARSYVETAKAVLAVVVPLLTKRKKSK